MLNQIILVGRITKELEVEKLENVKVGTMTLAIPRSFKNAEGMYDTDFINIKVFDSIAENVKEYCNKGDIVGVKGRIQSKNIEENGIKKYIMEIIAEKITFLSSSRKED